MGVQGFYLSAQSENALLANEFLTKPVELALERMLAMRSFMRSKTVDGVITSWNAGAERLYGYSSSTAIGQTMTTLLPGALPGDWPVPSMLWSRWAS